VEHTIQAMADLVPEDKVRYLGVSEVRPHQLRRAGAVHPMISAHRPRHLIENSAASEVSLPEAVRVRIRD
jgi:aryl-alcohol dehydrogenase-like predicted oxidoreductase